MFNINLLRNDLENTKKKLINRNYDIKNLDEILDLDIKIRELKTKSQSLNEIRNKKSNEISSLMKEKKFDEVEKIKNEVSKMKSDIEELETNLNDSETKLNNLLSYIPNICCDDVPVGKDEASNKEVKKWGEPRKFSFTPLAHWDLAEKKKLFLTDESTKITGSRFVTYFNDGAKLYRALQQFTLDHNIANGFIEVFPQSIINADSLYGTGQLPKFKEDVFKLENMNYYLSPTAEVQLTNIFRNNIIDKELPIKFTANTTCYRSEAGSAGRDTRGVIRLHQFLKTELVVFAHPNDSFNQLENITKQAESVLEALKLPYRRLLLCTGDTGFSSTKTYDVEVWLPSYNSYKEISSCSNCGDFQARRSKIRFKEEKESVYVHTLNGSGLALDRLWAAVVENYQQKDGSIKVPEVLKKYLPYDSI